MLDNLVPVCLIYVSDILSGLLLPYPLSEESVILVEVLHLGPSLCPGFLCLFGPRFHDLNHFMQIAECPLSMLKE